jgi:membrane protein YqaA with SNARE-associated domain
VKIIKRLYDWVLSWADTPYGGLALFVIAFAESSVFPVPPDVLLIALCLGNRGKWSGFAWICTVGSLLGGLFGYAIGWGLWHAVDQFFFNYVPGFTQAQFDRVQGLYDAYNFWIVFIAAFTPIPYKVITISAGVFGINFVMFTIASIVGRSARFFLVAWLLHRYGEPIHGFIEKRFNLLTVAFVVLLGGGFVVLKMIAD